MSSLRGAARTGGPEPHSLSPSVTGPESFPRPTPDQSGGRRVTPSVARHSLRRRRALSRVSPARAVLLPERFRGGCSFGGGGLPPLSPARAPSFRGGDRAPLGAGRL